MKSTTAEWLWGNLINVFFLKEYKYILVQTLYNVCLGKYSLGVDK